MNYLAHLYLSGTNPEIQAGNLFADEVKGKDLSRFPEKIELGIRMHRFIDSYADTHEINLEVKRNLYSYFGKYAGVALDLYFDHFLAKDWESFSDVSLESYSLGVYDEVKCYLEHFGQKSGHMFHYMVKYNWLLQYESEKGILDIFNAMSKRLPERSGMKNAKIALEKHYDLILTGFQRFMPQLILSTRSKFEKINY